MDAARDRLDQRGKVAGNRRAVALLVATALIILLSTPSLASTRPDSLPQNPEAVADRIADRSAAHGTSQNHFVNVAHRGASGEAPENTRAAVRLALAQGADSLEFDVQRSADGRLVVFHDRSLRRTTDVEQVFPGRTSYLVEEFTLAELRRLDAGSWFSPQFAGEKILTLTEMLAQVRGRLGSLVEIKAPPAHPGIVEDVAEALDKGGFAEQAIAEDRLIVGSINRTAAREYHRLRPNTPVAVLAYRPQRETRQELQRVSEFASALGTGEARLPATFVERAHELGIDRVFTRGERFQDKRFMLESAAGDGVLTDHPHVMTAALAEDQVILEGESLVLPAFEASAPVARRGNCCAVRWSDNAYLEFAADSVGDELTVSVDVPVTGSYELSAIVGQAPDYGAYRLEVDDQQIGETIDGYAASVRRSAPVALGSVSLRRGNHDLTLSATGRNAESGGFGFGLDTVAFRRTGPGQTPSGPGELLQVETYATPYYAIDIMTAPQAAILQLGVDPSGRSDYRPVLEALDTSGRPAGTRPFVGSGLVGSGTFGPVDRADAARQVHWSPDRSKLTLVDIPIADRPISVTWTFYFSERSFDHELVWDVQEAVANVWQLGWNLDTNLPRRGKPGELLTATGHVRPFPKWTLAGDDYLSQEELTLVSAYVDGSADGEDDVFFARDFDRVAWTPFWARGGSLLPAGLFPGGCWRIGASSTAADSIYADNLLNDSADPCT